MTLCIAAISQKSIVCVSDTMVSTDEFSADLMALKSRRLHPDWSVFIAGNDLTRVIPLLSKIKNALAAKWQSSVTLAEIETLSKRTFHEELTQKATDLVLARYDLDMTAFVESGLKRFGSSQFATMKYEIDNTKLDCLFMFYGFDENKNPHIFTIGDPGEVCNHDLYGFWAIGNGVNRALSAMFFHPYTKTSDIWMALYCLCEAKFMAYSAGKIGEETLMTVSYPDRTASASMSYGEIKQLWEQQGAPRIPATAESLITKLLEGFAPSDFEESAK